MLSSIVVMKAGAVLLPEDVDGTLFHLLGLNLLFNCPRKIIYMSNYLKLDVLMMVPQELTAVILELVSNERVLGEMGPDKLMPCVEPPE